MDYLRQLCDVSGFTPRWKCGVWTTAGGWSFITAEVLIALAYLAIPIALVYFAWKRKDLPARGLFNLFAIFITLCGLTHLLDACLFWWPAYRLMSAGYWLTAVVSWWTVFRLLPWIPRLLALKSPEELLIEIERRRCCEQALQEANELLSQEICHRRKTEEQLCCEKNNLQAQVNQRAILENHISFLQTLSLSRSNEARNATDRLDAVVGKIEETFPPKP